MAIWKFNGKVLTDEEETAARDNPGLYKDVEFLTNDYNCVYSKD